MTSEACPKSPANLVAGISLQVDPEHDAGLLRRWPHLTRPGAGAANQIAPTFEEQIARAKAARTPPPLTANQARQLALTMQTHAHLFCPLLLDLLTEPLADAISQAVIEAIRGRRTP